MKVTVKFDGIDELAKGLARRAVLTTVVTQVVRSNTGKMQERAMRYAPVDTGHLKRSITADILDAGLTGVVESDARNSYGDNYAVYQEYGTRYQPGTPHVGPAFNDTKGEFIEDIKKAVRGI